MENYSRIYIGISLRKKDICGVFESHCHAMLTKNHKEHRLYKEINGNSSNRSDLITGISYGCPLYTFFSSDFIVGDIWLRCVLICKKGESQNPT